MPASKVKNIILLILALVNVLLLCLVTPLARERRVEAEETAAQLEALFGRYDIRLDAGTLPDTRTLYTLEFSPGDDAGVSAMQALLGDMVLAEDDSTRYLRTYSSALGTCSISRSGELSARLEQSQQVGDLEKAARDQMKEMGVEAVQVELPVRRSAGVYTVTVYQKLQDVPVFSAALQFTFQNSELARLEGTVYFDVTGLSRTDDTACISCADALVAFLGSRDELGWVGASVTDAAQGYLRSGTASAAVVRLTPGWKIHTDTGAFWVNGITREVTAMADGASGVPKTS